MDVLIGVDPHKASHTAVAIDRDEQALSEMRVRASSGQLGELLAWAKPFPDRVWAIESASGLGYLLAQQLVGAGEHVVDVPPTLSARARVLASGRSSKNDPNDAFSAAVAALRSPRLRSVTADDHTAILRMLADRLHALGSARTQCACRAHAMLAALVPGGFAGRLTVSNARKVLAEIDPVGGVAVERTTQTEALVADLARLDQDIRAVKARINTAVAASGTNLLELYGVGPVVAAIVLGNVGDPRRFPTRHQFASYNGTAPIEASSGPTKRHRLNPRGNRRLNHAIHIVAVAQISHASAGRQYYERKISEGKTKKEALRALKRRISDVIYRQLTTDLR
jgi:transposase